MTVEEGLEMILVIKRVLLQEAVELEKGTVNLEKGFGEFEEKRDGEGVFIKGFTIVAAIVENVVMG